MQEYSSTLKVGTILVGKYRVDKLLGEGGFGAVYKAYDMGLDRYVALKECLPCDFAARSSDNTTVRAKTQASVEDFEWAKTRFIEEARTLAKFRNVNLLSSNNIFQANGTVYMDSDFIEGINLEDIYVDNKICEEAEVLNVFKGILNGLKEVHSAGLMHRDIKPANIIIRSSDTQPVLIDFGSARMAVSSKTKPLTAMVTQGYAPLEQYYEDGNQGAWTDIYALAGVCYKMITGEKPPEAVARIKRDTIIKLSERYEGKYSGNLLRLLDQCLAVDEEERPQSVDECFNALKKQSALKSIQSEDSVQAIKVPKVPKLGGEIKSNKKNIWAKGLLISIIFLIIMGVVYALYPIKDYDALHQEAKIAYDSKDYARAIELSVEAVRKDYAWAQNLLALCYYRGNGVTQNYTEALRWWKKSAEQGYAFAQCSLGDCYERGNGVTQNYTEAVKWYRKSAEQGNAYAEQALKRLGD